FQAEDGIRDFHVTGVQTCALPISGKFLSADLDKASEDNERNSVLLRTASGQRLVVVQIAGLVARRIVCQVGEGEDVEAGSTYGQIGRASCRERATVAGGSVGSEEK